MNQIIFKMRIGIYTNRLPYPPIGGIPRFLHGLNQAFSLFNIKVEFILPNLADSSINLESFNQQNHIEDALALNSELSEKNLLIKMPQDIIVNLENCVKNQRYSSQDFHSLYLNENKIFNLLNKFDALIISGSVLLIYNNSDFIKLISSVSIPKLLFIPFPLAEIEFYYGAKNKKYIAKCIENWSVYCSGIVVPSEYSKKELVSNCDIKVPIHKIPYSINLQDFYSKEDSNYQVSGKNVISVSRLSHFSEHKNIDCLLDAWSIIKNRVPEATLTLIGAIPQETRFNKRLLNQNGIIITGEISDCERNKILKKGRVFVLPSTIEAFGFSFLESLAAGVPVIGMNSTATPEIVINGKNGILLEPKTVNTLRESSLSIHQKPDKNELAFAVIDILTNDLLYSKLHQSCFASITTYDHSRFAENYISFFLNISSTN